MNPTRTGVAIALLGRARRRHLRPPRRGVRHRLLGLRRDGPATAARLRSPQTIGGVLVGFDEQVLGRRPPGQEVVEQVDRSQASIPGAGLVVEVPPIRSIGRTPSEERSRRPARRRPRPDAAVLPWLLVGWLAIMTVVTFPAYARDKRAARTGARRTPGADPLRAGPGRWLHRRLARDVAPPSQDAPHDRSRWCSRWRPCSGSGSWSLLLLNGLIP